MVAGGLSPTVGLAPLGPVLLFLESVAPHFLCLILSPGPTRGPRQAPADFPLGAKRKATARVPDGPGQTVNCRSGGGGHRTTARPPSGRVPVAARYMRDAQRAPSTVAVLGGL